MNRAKQLGGARYEAFDRALRERLIERMTTERDLRHALARDELELHYQPLIDLVDERIVGFEALLRWRHPERGMISPNDFIHIAEETGLIIPIGSWVLGTVCEQLARWPEAIHDLGKRLTRSDPTAACRGSPATAHPPSLRARPARARNHREPRA